MVEVIPLIAMPRNTTSKLDGLYFTHPFNADRQAGKLRIPTFKGFGQA